MIIVNGVTGSIGRTVAETLIKNGSSVIGVGRNSQKLEELEKIIPGIITLLYNKDRIEDQIDQISNQIEGLDLENKNLTGYVHCIGQFERFSSPLEITSSEWIRSIEVNLTSNFFWNQWALKEMIPHKHGSIVNLVSQASRTGGFSAITPYAASKGAIVSMTKNLSNWAGQFNIRVNCLSPGFVDNEMMNKDLSHSASDQMRAKVPLGRFSTNSEIANAVKFLISNDSSYITGTILDVAGGLTNI
jgi:3-oxoacyl-[acyl-carrier protein] reductase